MTLTLRLRVSPPSFDVFSQWGRFVPRLRIVLLRAAPLFTLAFPGPLLPLRQPTPALPPLFAVPRAKRPRRPELRNSTYKMNFQLAVAKLQLFCETTCQRTIFISMFVLNIAISRKGFQPLPASPPLIKSGRSRALGARLVCFVSPRPRLSALSPYSCQNGSVSQSSAASQRAAPQTTQAPPGPRLPRRQPTPAEPPTPAAPRAKRPRRPEVRPL